MKIKVILRSLEDLYEVLRDPDIVDAMLREGYLEEINNARLGTVTWGPTEKLLNIMEKVTGHKGCRKCFAAQALDDSEHRGCLVRLLTTISRNGYEWYVNPSCPHEPNNFPKGMSHIFVAIGTRSVAVDVLLNEAEWDQHLKNFREHGKYRDTDAALFFIVNPKFKGFFLRTPKDCPWIYFALYQDVMEDFKSTRIFQEGRYQGMDLQTFLDVVKNSNSRKEGSN